MITPVSLVDLDDTLFQTKRKLGDKAKYLVAESPTNPSYETEVQRNFNNWLFSNSLVIPVTARPVSHLSRIKLPFKSYKIFANGAVILNPDNSINTNWEKHVLYLSTLALDPEMPFKAASWCPNKDKSIYEEKLSNGRYASLTVSYPSEQQAKQAFLCIPESIRDANKIDLSGRKILIIPHYIDKYFAAKRVLELLDINTEITPVMTYGNAFSDRLFMGLGHYSCLPKDSDLDYHMRYAE